MQRRNPTLRLTIAVALVMLAVPLRSAAPQCPAVGPSSDCSMVIGISPQGFSVTQPNVTPLSSDDFLVGVVNTTGSTIGGLALTAPGAFAFNDDGLCTVTGFTCTWAHPTTYEGPITTFDVTDAGHANVFFSGGLSNDASTYFSLEGVPSVRLVGVVIEGPGGGGGPPPPTTVPEPTTATLIATALLGVLGAAGRRRTRAGEG